MTVSDISSSIVPTVCALPPSGWLCTRAPGHDGPCAARPAPEVGEWLEAQRICDLPDVHEAIQGFADDQTVDNATMIVREVMRAISQRAGSGDDPIGQFQAEAMQRKLDDFVGSARHIDDGETRKFNAARLRRAAHLVGLADAIPLDDGALLGSLGSVLGMICRAIEHSRMHRPVPGVAQGQLVPVESEDGYCD